MHAMSVNYRDLAIADGRYPAAILPDVVPLSDGAGEIVELGTDVEGWRVGDRVCGIFTQSWLAGRRKADDGHTDLGGPVHGVLTEFRCFEAHGLVEIPSHLSFPEAATLPCAAVTAWNALFGARPVQTGETVLVMGTGGVSTFALQFATMAGARVITISSSDEKLEKHRKLGAAELVNYRRTPDWDGEVLRLTGGKGVDHVVEIGGPGTLDRSLAALAMNGQVNLVGVLSQGQMSPLQLIGSNGNMRGLIVGSRDLFEQMNRAIEMHDIKPAIHEIFPFDRATDAYRSLLSADHVGKLVITV
jgi:NADPH:quinone reductase-like Zn-dependent oxidoreductase